MIVEVVCGVELVASFQGAPPDIGEAVEVFTQAPAPTASGLAGMIASRRFVVGHRKWAHGVVVNGCVTNMTVCTCYCSVEGDDDVDREARDGAAGGDEPDPGA